VECPRVCVIDSSSSIRETIAVVLGGGYGVQGLTPDEYLRDPSKLAEIDLLVVADDALPIETLSALVRGHPTLWLQSRRGPPPVATGQWAAIPRMFSPEELRSHLQALLAKRGQPRTTWNPWAAIEYPILPKEAAALARRATDTHLPVLLCGEPGTGKTRLARGIHSLGPEARLIFLPAANCSWTLLRQAASDVAGSLTVFVNDVSHLNIDAQQLVMELLDCGGFPSEAGWHSVRLICATAQTFEHLARIPSLAKDLFYRLSVLPITLPPLRERPYDIPPLAHYLATELARGLSAEPVTFTPRAIHRLMHYLWFGNLAELEAVLARTLALTPSRIIDAEDLLFGYGRIAPRLRETSAPVTRKRAAELAPSEAVELIINELAHEFKNPMVTIKTVAQHLERLLADESGRQQIARLTGEAVDRMDRTLENLLEFTRFRTPALDDVALHALLAPSLSDLAPALAERGVVLNYQAPGPAVRVCVDSAQIMYAIDNTLRAIMRDLVAGQTLSIHQLGSQPAVVFEFTTAQHPIAGKLAGLIDAHGGEQVPLPLGLLFAKVLVERNGGRVEIRSAADNTAITLSLPTGEEITREDGPATNFDC
jgi:two-component system response regulator HydG